MVKILSFLDDDAGLNVFNSENVQVIKQSSDMDYNEYYDIIIYDTLSFISFEEIRLKLSNKKIYRIAILDDMDELDIFKNFKTDAWLLKDKVSTHFQELLDNLKDDLKLRLEIYAYIDRLEKITIHNDIHTESFDILKSTIKNATKSIEKNFEARVKEIRETNEDLTLLKEEINAVKEVLDDEPLLINPVHTLEQIVGKNDDTIKSLFEFVMILQCEDRIEQLVDGILNIVKEDIKQIKSLDIEISDELKKKIKLRMVDSFYLQEQRDIALDVESKEVETGTLTLF